MKIVRWYVGNEASEVHYDIILPHHTMINMYDETAYVGM